MFISKHGGPRRSCVQRDKICIIMIVILSRWRNLQVQSVRHVMWKLVKRQERCHHLWGTYKGSLNQLCKNVVGAYFGGAYLKLLGGTFSPEVPRIIHGHRLHTRPYVFKHNLCTSLLETVQNVTADFRPCFLQRLLLLVSFNRGISFSLFKSWECNLSEAQLPSPAGWNALVSVSPWSRPRLGRLGLASDALVSPRTPRSLDLAQTFCWSWSRLRCIGLGLGLANW